MLLAGAAMLASPVYGGGDELYRDARQLRTQQAAEIERLAAWCDQQGLTAEAQQTRGLIGPRDPLKLYLAVLPEKVGRPKLPADVSDDLTEWDQRLALLQRDQANALFELARRAIRGRRASLAYELVLAAIRTNPDHKAIRRLLGYREFRGRWHTLYEIDRLRAGQVRHEKFGWLPRSHVRRYEQGQRFTAGRWITAAEDAELHHDIRSGWPIETEHYRIITNHSLEAGVELGAKLERLYRVWQQLFVRYYASAEQVVQLFDERARAQSRRTPIPRLTVVFFRDREDYVRSLKPAMPNIGVSVGLYLKQMQTAYFFAGKDYEDRTLYHEATHQLFHQSRPVAPNVGGRANFWIVEGIAMYMESLRREGGYDSLGGFDDQRMYAARYRLLDDDFYVPLEEFVAFGMEDLQSDRRMATLYSQAAGLANFLVHYDGGRYRDALIAYLTEIYNGQDTRDTLARLTGASYGELDRQYRCFMQESVQH